jgi:hypothetical protein
MMMDEYVWTCKNKLKIMKQSNSYVGPNINSHFNGMARVYDIQYYLLKHKLFLNKQNIY